jgi:hypothetical protein
MSLKLSPRELHDLLDWVQMGIGLVKLAETEEPAYFEDTPYGPMACYTQEQWDEVAREVVRETRALTWPE